MGEEEMCGPKKDTVRSLVEENANLSSEVISLLGISLNDYQSTTDSIGSLLSDVNDRLYNSNCRLREVIIHLKEVL